MSDATDPILAGYMTRTAPRYTSYPTAPHFHDGVGDATYRGWLKALDPAQPVSLYAHVPFCRQLCWYCGCNMKLAARYKPVADYVETLLSEIALAKAALPARLRATHLHFGGGTPTALEPDDLARAMDALRSAFDVAEDAEIAIECDPRTLSDAMIARIGALGFNRASFGVQEFDLDVQRAINRIQPPAMVARAVDGLRAAGVERVNFDLVYGLPRQTRETLEKTVALAGAMRPDRVALFGYAHVPWMAKKQRLIDAATLPGAAERLAQAEAAARAFEALGYQAIGIDHFARPDDPLAVAARAGRLGRNFQGYTTDDAPTLIGFGPSSIGRTPQGFAQNATETGAWAREIAAGRFGVAKGRAFAGEDALRAHVIEAIMCQGAVDLAAAAARFGAPADGFAAEEPALAAAEADGLLTRQGGAIRLTERGRKVTRVVASFFDVYFQAGQARHSTAV